MIDDVHNQGHYCMLSSASAYCNRRRRSASASNDGSASICIDDRMVNVNGEMVMADRSVHKDACRLSVWMNWR